MGYFVRQYRAIVSFCLFRRRCVVYIEYFTYIYIVTIKFEVNDKPSYWKNDLSATQFLLYYSVYVVFQIILSTHKNKLLQWVTNSDIY